MKKSLRNKLGVVVASLALAAGLIVAPAASALAVVAPQPVAPKTWCTVPTAYLYWEGYTVHFVACRPWNSGGATVYWITGTFLTADPAVAGAGPDQTWIPAGTSKTWQYAYPAKTTVVGGVVKNTKYATFTYWANIAWTKAAGWKYVAYYAR